MKVHHVVQGSPEWLALRAIPGTCTASEAAAMMSVCAHTSRTELLHRKHTGISPEVGEFQQKLFDKGHATEAQYRPTAEEQAGEDLYPVTGTLDVDGLLLLASFDGLTIDYALGYEHKLWNQALADHLALFGEPPPSHYWQLEHQLLVSGAQRILFVTSDGTADCAAFCWYESRPERRAQLIAGWKQFAKDLAAYQPEAQAAKPIGRSPESLPALSITVTGAVTASNLDGFKAYALEQIKGINRNLKTDQDFADAAEDLKWCSALEERLEATKGQVLGQTESIDAVLRTLEEVKAFTRETRLAVEKLVTKRKDEIKAEILNEFWADWNAQVNAMNATLGTAWLFVPPAGKAALVEAIKGKRTVESLRDACRNVVLARTTEAQAQADRLAANRARLERDGHGMAMFPDFATAGTKAAEDFEALLQLRVRQHQEEADRREQAANAAKAAQEAAAAQAAAALAAVQAEAPAPAPTPAPAQAAGRPAFRAVAPAPAPAADEPYTLRLGRINDLLGFTVTADLLERLGFKAHQAGAAKLYRESDFPRICDALSQHALDCKQGLALAA